MVGQGAEGEDVDDVGMVDEVDRPSLFEQALLQIWVLGELGRQDLDGHLLANHRLLARIDLPHATFPDLAFDHVLADAGARLQIGEPRRVAGHDLVSDLLG